MADPKLLGERRTLAVTAFVLIPSSLFLIVTHLLFFDSNYHRVSVIFGALLVGLFSLYAQAYKDWARLAGISLIAALWIAPVSLMLEEGFSSSNWAWLLPVILLTNFILSRRASIIFTLISVVTLIVVAVMTLQGWVGYPIDTQDHAITVSISGSLIFVLACALGYFYRTNQLRAEQQLRNNMQRLAVEVDVRRHAELKALAGERAKATFLTTVSHELRTPLNGVIGASDLLSGKSLSPDVQDLVNVIKTSGEMLLDVINNVLDLSMLDEGKLSLVNAPIDFHQVVGSCCDPLSVLAGQKSLELNLTIDSAVPRFLNADAARIRQLVMNVCGNAIKFTDKGAITIYLGYEDQLVVLNVKDTGVGIPPESLEEIFQPFTQVDSSADRRFGGSGLGLSIVKRLVELVGGEIDIQSELGVGTEFKILLPMQPITEQEFLASTELASQRSLLNDFPAQGATVLVTDDNAVNRQVASQLLIKLGHNVLEAKDGSEAVETVKKGNIDLVLMDVQMPVMDGISATKKIRKMKGLLGQTPIIGLTANAMAGDENEMRSAGMNGYLAKPVRLEQLKQALSSTTPPKRNPQQPSPVVLVRPLEGFGAKI
jgi:signal transduction histidine kinase/CheY-like chemotaxis protein